MDDIDGKVIAAVGRRTALVRAGRLATMVAVTSLLGARPRRAGAAAKLAQSVVQYRDLGNIPDKDCDDCVQFMPGKTPTAAGTCRIVEGVIAPHGHCLAFTPRPK